MKSIRIKNIFNDVEISVFKNTQGKTTELDTKEYIFKYRSATQLTDDIVEEIHSHAKILKDKLLIMGLPMIPSFSGLNVCPFSRGKNCDSFNALNWWHQNGIKNIIVGDPLFFQLPDAKKYYPDVKIYCIPNDLRQGLYSAGKPDDMWIQPECIDKYEGLIDVIFFEAETVNQEEALFKIYAQEKRWAGNFNILMPTSIYDCNNESLNVFAAKNSSPCGKQTLINSFNAIPTLSGLQALNTNILWNECFLYFFHSGGKSKSSGFISLYFLLYV